MPSKVLSALTFILLALVSIASAADPPASSPAFSITGKLQTGVMAVGAETTGITITLPAAPNTRAIFFELDIRDANLHKKAETLNGQEVTVSGTLTIRQGVEVRQRRIVAVDKLEVAASPATRPAATTPG